MKSCNIGSFFSWFVPFSKNVFKDHPYCSMYQNILFIDGYYSIVHIYHIDGHLDHFHLLATMNDAVTIGVQVPVWAPVFNSFGYIPRSGIAESFYVYLFEEPPKWFHRLHHFAFPPAMCTSVPISLRPHQYSFSAFPIIFILVVWDGICLWFWLAFP